MEEMKTIYQVEGKLCKDFIGQISYTVCLDQTYGELDIEFSFGPQHFRPEDVTPEPQPAIEGVLKVTILVFSVLLDDTNYQLTIRAR